VLSATCIGAELEGEEPGEEQSVEPGAATSELEAVFETEDSRS